MSLFSYANIPREEAKLRYKEEALKNKQKFSRRYSKY